MGSYITTLGCRMKGLTSSDIISVAVVFIENEVPKRIMISEKKMDVLKYFLEENVHDFFISIIKGYERNLDKMNYKTLERQSRYQNGIVYVSSPSPIAINIIDEDKREEFLDNLFRKRIDYLPQ
jgi:hypothetical protein